MAKALKIIVIVFLGLAVLAALAVTFLPKLLPLDSMVTEAVEENLGRKATVQEVSASLWGGLEVRVKDLVVQDKAAYGQRPLLKLGSLQVEASLWPLVSGHVVVDRIVVDGLEVSLVRAKDGRLNWEDLPAQKGAAGGKGERGHAEAPDEGKFILRQLAVTNSALYLLNQANGKSSQLPLERCQLSSDLSLDASSGNLDLALPGLSLATGFKSRGYGDEFKLDQGKLNCKLDLAELVSRLAPLAPALQARGTMEFTGLAMGDAKDLKVQTQAQAKGLEMRAGTMRRPFLVGDASWAAQVTVHLQAETVNIEQAQLLIPQAGMVQTLKGVLGWGKALGQSQAVYDQQTDLAKLAHFLEPLLPWPVKAGGQASKHVLFKGAGPGALEMSGQGLVRNAMLESPALPRVWREPEMRADFKLLVKDEGRELDIRQMDWVSSMAKLGLTGTVKSDGDKSKLRLKVAGEYLDLDRLNPGASAEERAKAPTAEAKAAQAQAAAPSPQAAAAAPSAQAAEARQSLKGLDAELEIKLGRLVMRGYEMKNLLAELEVKDQKAQVKKFQAGILDGEVQTKAAIDFKPAAPAGDVDLRAQNLTITPEVFRKLKYDFPMFSLPLSSLEGVFSLDSQMAWQGLESEQVRGTLKGKGLLKAEDGVTIGMDFLDSVQAVAALMGKDLSQQLPRRFEKFEGKYTMGQGKVNYDIALMASKDRVDAQIVGTTGLLDDSLDANIKFKADSVGRDLRQFLDEDGTFPIGVGGTIQKPVAKVDLSGNLIPAAQKLFQNLFKRK